MHPRLFYFPPPFLTPPPPLPLLQNGLSKVHMEVSVSGALSAPSWLKPRNYPLGTTMVLPEISQSGIYFRCAFLSPLLVGILIRPSRHFSLLLVSIIIGAEGSLSLLPMCIIIGTKGGLSLLPNVHHNMPELLPFSYQGPPHTKIYS